MSATEPSAADVMVFAIHTGDVAEVQRLVAADPAFAGSPLGGRYKTRTPLAVVADWPGYFPNGPEIVRVLVAAGAAPDGPEGRQPGEETPLHWAASSDDIDVAGALIDAGADIEAPHGSIGTPLDNAIGYACWDVARLLVARGARVDKLWNASALGLVDRLRELMAERAHSPDEISQAFWHACSGGKRRAAEFLLDAGADIGWSPEYAYGTALDAAQGDGTQRQNVITWLAERG
ncbi:MAG TPA: ankyrin repeat domain-containing protein, partial [Acidimicrobiia bacterium]